MHITSYTHSNSIEAVHGEASTMNQEKIPDKLAAPMLLHRVSHADIFTQYQKSDDLSLMQFIYSRNHKWITQGQKGNYPKNLKFTRCSHKSLLRRLDTATHVHPYWTMSTKYADLNFRYTLEIERKRKSQYECEKQHT